MGKLSKRTDEAAEVAQKARRKVELKRETLSKMSVSDPHRPSEEAMLSSMIQSASMADMHLAMLMDEEEAGSEAATDRAGKRTTLR